MELPEVEVMRRDLEKEVVGKRVKSADVRPQRNAMRIIRRHARRKDFADRVASKKITKVDRKGKYVLLYLEGGDVLVVHFGMSGQFVRGTKRQSLPPHTHVVIEFQQGGDLRFVDPRTFGELFVTTPEELPDVVPELAHLGFDPVEDMMSWTKFGELLTARKAKLKALLMDQKFMAGVGNIYSDEILFAAGLRYDRSSETLSSQEVRRLYRAMVETLQDAIKHRGSSLADEQYRDLFGETGEYQNMHKVYDREGQACRRCRSTIVRVKFNGRSSFLCPQCQV